MYNRYIPQPDGSFRRSSVPTSPPRRRSDPPAPPQPVKETVCEPERPYVPDKPRLPFGAGEFLKKLLPKDLDTGDLLIIVLLLLMSADCEEENNSALLTLALYLFL